MARKSGTQTKQPKTPEEHRGKTTGQARRHSEALSRAEQRKNPSRKPLIEDSTKRDIVGVSFIIVAVALLVAAFLPEQGVVSEFISNFLRMTFGVGVYIIPFFLAAIGVTFIIRFEKERVPLRAAIGFGIIFVAILGLIALSTPIDNADYNVIFNRRIVMGRGGYIGAALAWSGLKLFGPVITGIILVGIIIIGVLVIGFSVSAVVELIRRKRRLREEALSSAPAQPFGRIRRSSEGTPENADIDIAAIMAAADPAQGTMTRKLGSYSSNPLPAETDASNEYHNSMMREFGYVVEETPTPPSFTDDAYAQADGMQGDPYATRPCDGYGMPFESEGAASGQTYQDSYGGAGYGEEPYDDGVVMLDRHPVVNALDTIDLGQRGRVSETPAYGDAYEDGDLSAEKIYYPLVTQRIDDAYADMPEDDCDPYGEGDAAIYGDPYAPEHVRPPRDAYDMDPFAYAEGDSAELDGGMEPYDLYAAAPTRHLGDGDPESSDHAAVYGEDGMTAPWDDETEDVFEDDGSVDGRYADAGFSEEITSVQPDPGHGFSEDDDDEPIRGKHAAGRKASSVKPAPQETVVEKAAPEPVSPRKAQAAEKAPVAEPEGFTLPPLDLLVKGDGLTAGAGAAELEETSANLQTTLEDFGVMAKVVGWVAGPTVTLFKIELPPGVRVSKITNLNDDIALALAAPGVRIFAPIPGTNYVGIEVPNKTRKTVYLTDVLKDAGDGPMEICIGKDVEGNSIVSDLAKMPHLLIAGTTGSGKSVEINGMIMSILMRATPDQVRFIMIDPKRVEFSGYNGIPHLYVPVVTECKDAAAALAWGVAEMERRLKLFSKVGVRNIATFNEKAKAEKVREEEAIAAGEEDYANPFGDPVPYIVIIIDELADLMMNVGKEVEGSISRIAQLARAAGIHLIIATQRPSTNVVTGLIKANITCRIGLTVASGIDSRVILDSTGAENLCGYGDLLISKPEYAKPVRVQGPFVSDDEINGVVEYLKTQGEPEYHSEILQTNVVTLGDSSPSGDGGSDSLDPLIWEAADMVVASGAGSTSSVQRRLKVGYSRAGRIMDQLCSLGIVGEQNGSKPREVLVDEMELESLKAFTLNDE